MKAFVGTMAGAMVLVAGLGAWSFGARLMNQQDDFAVVKGILVIAGVVGAAGALAGYLTKVIWSAIDRVQERPCKGPDSGK